MKDLLPLILLAGLLALTILGFVLYKKNFKKPRLSAVTVITGAVKTFKSGASVCFATKQYNKNLREYYFKFYLAKVIHFITFKKVELFKDLEKPMFYSNMPVAKVRYNPLTLDILKRKVRIPYKSVVLIDEGALLADSLLFKDSEINEALTEWVKTFGHSTRGGSLFVNTHDLGELHFAFRRGSGKILYLYGTYSVGIGLVVEALELITSDSQQGGVNATLSGDLQENCYKMFFAKKWTKRYDKYYLSVLTDDLPVYVDYNNPILEYGKDSLKVKEVVTLQRWPNLDKRNKDMEALD